MMRDRHCDRASLRPQATASGRLARGAPSAGSPRSPRSLMKRSRSAKPTLPTDYLEPLVRALGDPAVLAGIRVEELQPVAFQLALYFGVRRDADTAAVLAGVYERLVSDVTPEARALLLDDLTAAVAGGATSVLALLPVLQRE